MESEGLAILSTGQQTPGTKRLLKHRDCLSFVRSSNNCGQLLRSWHFPGPPSAVVHVDGVDSLSLFVSSSADCCCCCCWSGGDCVDDAIVCVSGKATPRTKGAILSVTLRPGKSKKKKKKSQINIEEMYEYIYISNTESHRVCKLINSKELF